MDVIIHKVENEKKNVFYKFEIIKKNIICILKTNFLSKKLYYNVKNKVNSK